MAENKIRAIIIFEMLGRPAEHLKKTLSEFIEKLDKEEGVEVKSKQVNEPKQIEDARQKIYTTFAETEIEFKDILCFFRIMFSYLPSHIEIIDPEELRMRNFDMNVLMNELVRRLHQYDEIAKGLAIQRTILLRQLQEAGIEPKIFMQQPVQEQKKGKPVKDKKSRKNTSRKSKKKR